MIGYNNDLANGLLENIHGNLADSFAQHNEWAAKAEAAAATAAAAASNALDDTYADHFADQLAACEYFLPIESNNN